MFDSSFEIKFSQLADSRLQEMVPSLNEYKVGFQLIDKNEDDTKGLGVMAFLINNTWVYIPAFFLSGKLKMPCLYLKKYDMRAPLNDSWVAFIKSNDIESLGTLVPNDAVKTDNAKADLLNIIGKTASEKNDLMTRDDIKNMLSARPCPATNMLEGLDKKAFITLVDTMNDNDEFANAVLKYYSPAELKKTAVELDSIEEEKPEALPVRILTKESSEAKDLDDAEKQKMIREGSIIKDDRLETSLVYKRDDKPDTGFATPSVSGFYEILMADGDVKKCIIVYPQDFSKVSYPANHGRRKILSRCAVIMADKPTEYFRCTAADLMTRNCKCIESSNIKGNNTKVKDDLSRVKLTQTLKTCTVMLVDPCGNAYTLSADKEWPKMHFTDKPGKLHDRHGVLMIPDNVLLFKEISDFDETGDRILALGNVNTFVKDCVRKAEVAPLKIHHDTANGYFITSNKVDSKPLKKKAALELLVFDHGIKVDEAEIMLKEASDHGVAPKTIRYMIKYAGVYDLSTDMGTIGREVKANTESNVTVSPQDMVNVATKASDTGLKEVMDTSIMASLIGTSRSLNKIGEFIPELIKAMDRLGSILMLYYWDNEEFEEQYGRVEMVELEEKLTDVFNSLGDITLFLKEKTADADSIFDGNKGNISEDMGDEGA